MWASDPMRTMPLGISKCSRAVESSRRLLANSFSCGGQMTGDAGLNVGLELLFAIGKRLAPDDGINEWRAYARGLYMIHHKHPGCNSGYPESGYEIEPDDNVSLSHLTMNGIGNGASTIGQRYS